MPPRRMEILPARQLFGSFRHKALISDMFQRLLGVLALQIGYFYTGKHVIARRKHVIA